MLNKALKLMRIYHNRSQIQVAEGLGLSKSFISEIESGRKQVSLETLQKYADYFQLPMSSLMLFAEQSGESGFHKNVKSLVAEKVLKMMDWMVTISESKSN